MNQQHFNTVFIVLACIASSLWGLCSFLMSLVPQAHRAVYPRYWLPWRRSLFVLLAIWFDWLFQQHPLLQLASSVTALALAFAELPIAWVLVPAGLVRTSYYVTRVVGHPATRVGAQLGPAFRASRALLNRPSEAGAQFISSRLELYADLTPLGVAASALVMLARGEREHALGVLRGLGTLPYGVAPREVMRVVHEILALEAATRADWHEVGEWAELHPRTPLTRLLEAIALRALGVPGAPGSFRLWYRWFWAPRRLATRALVVRALGFQRSQLPAPLGPMQAQLLLASGYPSNSRPLEVAAAVRGLDELRQDPEWAAEVERRALALGNVSAQNARSRILESIESDIADVLLVNGRPCAWLPPGPSGEALRERVKEARAERADRLAKELHRRLEQRRDLGEVEEWICWGQLAQACLELERDAVTHDDHVSLFRTVHRPLWSFGYRECFVRDRRTLGRAIFQFQRRLCVSAKAFDALETITNNAAAGGREALPNKSDLAGEPVHDLVRFFRVRRWARGATAVVFFGLMAFGFCFRWLWPDVQTAITGLAMTSALAYAFLVPGRIAELIETEDGVIVQLVQFRHVVQRRDVSLRAGPWGLLWVRLQRTPYWMPRRLWSVQASSAQARATAASFAPTVSKAG